MFAPLAPSLLKDLTIAYWESYSVIWGLSQSDDSVCLNGISASPEHRWLQLFVPSPSTLNLSFSCSNAAATLGLAR